MTREQLGGLYQTYFGRPLGQGDIQALGGEGGQWTEMSPEEFVQKTIFPSQEYATTGNPWAPIMANTLEGFAGGQSAQTARLLGSQREQQENLFGKFQQAISGQETMENAYSRLSNEAGLPGLSSSLAGINKLIGETQQMINQLDTNITERTKGTFTSEAQRQRQVAAEHVPLAKQLSEYGTAAAPLATQLSAAQQNIATRLGLISQDQQKALQPLILQIDSLSDRFAREITGWTQSKTTEFNAILHKITRQEQLDDAAVARANQLADEEKQWERTKEQLAIEQAYSLQSTAASKKGGGSSKATAAENKKSNMSDLTADIEDNLRNWVAQNKPAWFVEKTLLPELYRNYLPLGITKAQIDQLVYSTRRQSEYGGE